MTAPPKPVKAIRQRKPIARSSKRIERSKPPNRVRKTTLGAALRKLQAKFHAYVKERDGNTCFSCGRGGLEGQGWHAGHFLSAGKFAVVRWEPKNVHSQCYACNVNLRGNGGAYALRFLDVYGLEEMKRLQVKSREIRPWRTHEVLELIAALDKGGADYECLYAEKYGL